MQEPFSKYHANFIEFSASLNYLAIGYCSEEKSLVKIVDVYKFEVQNVLINGKIKALKFEEEMKVYTDT